MGQQINLRQLAKELNHDLQDLMVKLGKTSSGDMVDRDAAIAQLNQSQHQQPAQEQQQNYAPGMFGEVAGEFRQNVAVQAAMLALQGKQQLRVDTSNFWQMGEEQTRQLLGANGIKSPDKVGDTFDFFNKSQGFTSLDQMMNALGAENPTKQLLGAGVNSVSEPSTSQPEVNSQSTSVPQSETVPE